MSQGFYNNPLFRFPTHVSSKTVLAMQGFGVEAKVL
jgi:hypothetical protein